MRGNNSLADAHRKLQAKLLDITELRKLSFDDPKYEQWLTETGEVLDQIFGWVEYEQHPCTQAVLNYRIPFCFSATRPEMQQYYINMLQGQVNLLSIYLKDIEELLG